MTYDRNDDTSHKAPTVLKIIICFAAIIIIFSIFVILIHLMNIYAFGNISLNKSLFDDKQNWKQKHVKLLRQTYSKHPFSDEILPVCDIIENYDFQNLSDLNICLIKWVMKKLKIKTECFLSSELNILGKRTDRIIKILQKLNADIYLSPQGSAEYLDLDGFSDKTSVKLTFQSFEPKLYKQFRQDKFESHLSIIDVVANLGWKNTKKYII